MLNWLTDRLVLCPTRHEIESEYLVSETINTPFGVAESWYCDSSEEVLGQVDVHAIKFPGAGGRAERSSAHPFELWEGRKVRVWTVNHHGYGNSSGNATLQKFAETCDSIWEHIHARHSPKKILSVGNSLGCVSALYLAARYPVDGMFLRNPVPLSHLIRSRPRYNWWNFGSAKWIAERIPESLDAVDNATKCGCPTVFVQSERDNIVPTEYQDLIINGYGGNSKTFVIRGADHHHKIPVEQEHEYLAVVDWLQENVFEN